MTATTIRRLTSTILLAGLVWGCGGAASQAPSASVAAAPSAAPSASVAASPSVEPSVAPPSSGPSIALPSLPSEAKDLEALLPGTVCGATATKASLSGASFEATADQDFKNVLTALGKSASDVTFALAIGGSSGCAAGIFRIQGVDSGALRTAFEAEAAKGGDTFTEKNVGGKDVKIQVVAPVSNYLYFKGDAIIFVTAKTEAEAATILQQLP